MALKSPQWSLITFSWFHTVRWGNMQQNDISHALSYSRKPNLTVVVKIWPRACPFDLLSRFVRDFDIRQMSPYDFLDSSNHSASNDMRQTHVLMYGLRDRVPNSYLTTSPPMRGYITNFAPHLRCLTYLNSTHRVHTRYFKWNLALCMNCIRDF